MTPTVYETDPDDGSKNLRESPSERPVAEVVAPAPTSEEVSISENKVVFGQAATNDGERQTEMTAAEHSAFRMAATRGLVTHDVKSAVHWNAYRGQAISS